MHILFLTDNFPPEVNAPASRTFEHCLEWVKEGHQVTVLTCVPNFPAGKVFEGYENRVWPAQEEIEGITVIRVWSYIAKNTGFLKRTLDYISYMISAVFFAPRVRKVDLVVGTSPQFFTVWAAYIVAGYKGVPFVFELRDLWPESIRAVGAIRSRSVLWVLERIELFLYRRAEKIVSVTRSFKTDLVRRGIDANKIVVVTNGVDLHRFKPSDKDERILDQLGATGKFVAGYIGTHGMAHALETLIEAGRLLEEWGERDILILLQGDGARKTALHQYAEEENVTNVKFIASVPKEEVVRYWGVLDAAIIHLKHDSTFQTVIPSKLFEAMGMGIPVLHGVHGESSQIVTENKIGIVFEPENGRQLARGILKLRDDQAFINTCRKNASEAALKFDRVTMARSMLGELCRVHTRFAGE